LERINVPEAVLLPSIKKLCDPKIQILLKDNERKPTFNKDENIRLKIDFNNQNIRIKAIP
jgi:hypothetical protein